MKSTQHKRTDRKRANQHGIDPIRGAIAHVKQTVLNEYAPRAGEHLRLLRLALNEAEALAWQTSHPHLLFPLLATEKAQSAVVWHERQRALRRSASEFA